MNKLWLKAVLLMLIIGSMTMSWADTPLIPMRDFFRNPTKTNYQLSPDGQTLAFMQPWQDRLNIHVQKIGSETVTRVTAATERDIAGYMWANNERLVFVQDKGGDENFKLYAVNLDGSDQKTLTPFDSVQVQIIDDLEDLDEYLLIGLNKRDKRIFDAYRININSGEMTLVGENPGNISQWVTDNDGKLRVAVTTDGVNNSLLYRAAEGEPFKTLQTTSFKETLSPLYFTYDNKYLYMASNLGRDKMAIVKYDPATTTELKVVFEHPEVDVSNLIRSNRRKKITGVSYNTDKRHYHFFDKDRESLQKNLEGRLPGYEVIVASMSKDENKVLVRTFSDKSLGAYYYYDRDDNDFRKLVDVSPWLNEDHMADMKPIKYQSRDGLTIHGYLTLPKGVTGKNLPVVINPHGGPWHRDSWGFNPEVQFLANRGYAVLQMNFRGSTGYGKSFWQASFKQWGKTMQDDVSDGVKWLIAEGIADPKRIGIYGGSYGGYCTLAGLAFTPDLYACGVDYVGVSNIFTWMNAIPPYWEQYREMLYEMVGHPENDRELLESASPVFHIDNIKAPMLVAQGANDPRVPQQESDQMVEALKKRGIDVPYIVKENEGHGFRNEENRFEFYGAMEVFLSKHLGGRAESSEGS